MWQGDGAWHTIGSEKKAWMLREDPILAKLWEKKEGKLTWKDLWDLGWRTAVLYQSTNVVRRPPLAYEWYDLLC